MERQALREDSTDTKGGFQQAWEKKNNKWRICKLTLTAQQGECVDRGEADLIYWLQPAQGETERQRDKTNLIIFFHQEENLSLSLTKDPPGLNQLQTNLILQREREGSKQ